MSAGMPSEAYLTARANAIKAMRDYVGALDLACRDDGGTLVGVLAAALADISSVAISCLDRPLQPVAMQMVVRALPKCLKVENDIQDNLDRSRAVAAVDADLARIVAAARATPPTPPAGEGG